LSKEKACPQIAVKTRKADDAILSFVKVHVSNINIKAIQIIMTLRIRGIERVLEKRGPLGFMLNLSSNFADISDAEFSFTELQLLDLQLSEEALQANLMKHYKYEAIQ